MLFSDSENNILYFILFWNVYYRRIVKYFNYKILSSIQNVKNVYFNHHATLIIPLQLQSAGELPNNPTWVAIDWGAPNNPTTVAIGWGAPNNPTTVAIGWGAPNNPTTVAIGWGAPNNPTTVAIGWGAPNNPTTLPLQSQSGGAQNKVGIH